MRLEAHPQSLSALFDRFSNLHAAQNQTLGFHRSVAWDQIETLNMKSTCSLGAVLFVSRANLFPTDKIGFVSLLSNNLHPPILDARGMISVFAFAQSQQPHTKTFEDISTLNLKT